MGQNPGTGFVRVGTLGWDHWIPRGVVERPLRVSCGGGVHVRSKRGAIGRIEAEICMIGGGQWTTERVRRQGVINVA